MQPSLAKTWVFRIIPIENLKENLTNGIYCKNSNTKNPDYKSIGSEEVITRIDSVAVKCHPGTVVNDYVPFYFSVRTPMLYNIITGQGVPIRLQSEIIYLCFKLTELATNAFQWCFTDGNAATRITRFYTDLENLSDLDWHSIKTTDFRVSNSDGDEDRIRKKHSEFLVKHHVPIEYLQAIVVLNEGSKDRVNAILTEVGLEIPVHINPSNEFYFI